MNENGAKISVYESLYKTKPLTDLYIRDYLKKVKDGWLKRKDDIQAIRMLDPLGPDDEREKYEALKKKLPGGTMSGCFKIRKNAGLETHSGLLAIDIDKKENINDILFQDDGLQRLKEKLKQEPWVYSIFISVGGRGLCCIVKIEPTIKAHSEAFKALQKYFLEAYNLTVDPKCSDVSHFRYISIDPELYYKPDAEIYIPSLDMLVETTKLPTSSLATNKQETFKLVGEIVEKVVKEEIMLGDDSYDNWMRIGFALVDEFGEEGRLFFHKISAVSSKYDQKTCDEQYTKCLNAEKRFDNKVEIGTFFFYAEKAGLHQGVVSKTNHVEELNKIIDSTLPDISLDTLHNILKKIGNIDKETERALLINRLSEKTKIGKSAIKKDLKDYTDNGNKDAGGKQEKLSAKFPGLVDIVIDEDTGTPIYLIKNENGTLAMASNWKNEEDGFYVPPGKAQLPYELARASKVIKWYENNADSRLFEDLKKYFKKFSYLPEEQWQMIMMSVFLSYLQDHDDIHYLPYLSFFAVPERGKSKTGKAMTYVSYRGIHVVELREANLFRYARDIGATLFFDIMNLWKKAVDNKVEDILLLRYERGARVSRVLYPEKGAFKDMEHYDIFGSTIFATNEAVDKILDTRCIPITMPNKPGRYEDPEPEKAQELKERLTAWRARVFDKPLPDIEVVPELNGRLWDISRPMLQVCRLVYPEGVQYLEEVLINISSQKKEEKGGYIEGQIVTALAELSPTRDESITDWNIWTSDVLNKLNADRSEDRKLTSQYLGKKLKAIGINKRKVNGKSQLLITKTELDMLLEQYGIDSLNSDTTPHTGSESREELVESLGNIDIFK